MHVPLPRRFDCLAALLVVCLFVLPSTVATDPLSGPDDAGSGRDAPDVPPSAIPLQEGVLYEAAFHDGEDRWDWYRIELETDATVHVELHAQSACVYGQPEGGLRKMACTVAGRPASLWFKAPAGPVDIAAEGGLPQSYVVTYSIDGFAPAPKTRVWAEDDAGSGRDAPGIATPRVPVSMGTTYRGFAGMTFDDLYDWYVLDVPPGTNISIMVSSEATACFHVVPETEADDPPACMIRYSELPSPVRATVGEGVWYLRVGAVATPYTFTITTA